MATKKYQRICVSLSEATIKKLDSLRCSRTVAIELLCEKALEAGMLDDLRKLPRGAQGPKKKAPRRAHQAVLDIFAGVA